MKLSRFLAGTALCLIAPSIAVANVTKFEIQSTTPAYDGQSFGDRGAYERIEAIATITIDPTSERGAGIVGIDNVPLNADGQVEFSTEVVILRPVSGEGSGTLFYEIVNRGRNLSFSGLNLSAGSSGFDISDPGDGFLMKRGHTIVWSGWQTHLDDAALNLTLPVEDGVTGLSREQFIFDDDAAVSTVTLTYPAADMDSTEATLTVRATPDADAQTPDGLGFKFIDAKTVEITRPAGRDGGAIYDFIYTAKDAVPTALGFVATSDIVSFLRGNPGHDATNPLSGVEHTIGLGISQSGRFMRDPIYQGYNADAAGARVFDGAMAHIAGSRKTYTNYPFAQTGRYSRQHEDHDYPGDQFPFTYTEMTDPLTGETDSILAKCEATQTCPKLMHTDTDTEFWQGRAALVSTEPDGTPLQMPDNVRLYYLAGAPHFNSWGSAPSDAATCDYDSNPISAAPVLRALEVGMENWVSDGTAPPDSIYPGLKGEGLVALADIQMPEMAGNAPEPKFNVLHVMDYSSTPPAQGAAYDARVPAVDDDGVAVVGVKLPYVAAPVGTYMGWNIRSDGFAAGELCGLTGSFVPFPATDTSDDSRSPTTARYESADAYTQSVRAAAEALVAENLMLASDIDLVVETAPKLELAAQ